MLVGAVVLTYSRTVVLPLLVVVVVVAVALQHKGIRLAAAGVLGVAALGSAFAGVITDPVQRALGLHRRRLLTFIDGLERAFARADDAGFVAYDLYVARLIDLSDVLLGITRAFRSA